MKPLVCIALVTWLAAECSAQFPDVIGRGGSFPDATNAVARSYAAQQYMMQMQMQQAAMAQAYAAQMAGYGQAYGYNADYGNVATPYRPYRAENGDIRGLDNDFDGRREPNHVRGYYRRNGDYTRGHYRAMPGW